MENLEKVIARCDKCHHLGIDFDKHRLENFTLSRKYKPQEVKVLWIVESPPLSDPPRYFYRPALTQYDGLFREVMKVLGIPVSNPKDASLKLFSDSGHFLIDSMKCPADKQNSYLKPEMLKNCSGILANEVLSINPESVIIVKADIYNTVYETMLAIKMADKVLNKQPVPFPGSGQQLRFRKAVQRLLNLSDQHSDHIEIIKIQTHMNKSIIVNNITDSDVSSNQLRITVANKHLFPSEKVGQPLVYNISLVFNGKVFSCTYRIGSKDGKSRSGVLKLGSDLVSSMKLRSSNIVTISTIAEGKYEIK